ncbi:hypothetical protein DdX_17902 [Ditylenchus destructor]|uniref:Uncharacterized protein n=1 Tax=Ditylenchus destructor TaxID=166010 RepID=A0AAD4MKV6_9BILA|nr:hypothetical protein DdX_17902 [Ditylenchus destructor]
MRSANFVSGVIIFYFISFISAVPNRTTTALSSHDPAAPTAQLSPTSIPDSQKALIKSEPYNDDMAKLLETLIKKAINNIGQNLIKMFGNFFRSKPKTMPFAGIAEKTAGAVVFFLANVLSKRVYDMTSRVGPNEIKNEGGLQRIMIKEIMSAREPLKETITQAINKKAEELKEKSGRWSEILAGVSKAQIAQLPGIDEELTQDIGKIIENAGQDLANKAYQKLKSPEKDKMVGKWVDHAYNGMAFVTASGEKVKPNFVKFTQPLDLRIGLQIASEPFDGKNVPAAF